MNIINTRNDLEALRQASGDDYRTALAALKDSMTTRVDVADHPESGPNVEPVWQDVETLQSIERLGFTKDEFLTICAEAGIGHNNKPHLPRGVREER